MRRKPDVDIVCTQEIRLAGANDPAVLEWAAEQGRIVVSYDVSTLTKHACDRVAAGLDMPGVFEVPTLLAAAI